MANNKSRARGAPRGNRNALKHGFYSHPLTKAQRAFLQKALGVDGVDQELALLRAQLITLLSQSGESLELQLRVINTIARLVAVQYRLKPQDREGVLDAITGVLKNIGLSVGLGVTKDLR